MKIRSLRQALHWLFLVVGIISLILLAVSASTYFSYAKEGYGLDLDLDSVNITTNNVDEYWMSFRFYAENPGRLNIIIQTANLTIGDGYYSLAPDTPSGLPQESFPHSELQKKDTEPVMFFFRISPNQYTQIEERGYVAVILDMELYVPERHCTTQLIFDGLVEVSAGA